MAIHVVVRDDWHVLDIYQIRQENMVLKLATRTPSHSFIITWAIADHFIFKAT